MKLKKLVLAGVVGWLLLVVGLWVRRSMTVPSAISGPVVVHKTVLPEGVRLFALGDVGSGDSDQYEVAQAMEERCRAVGAVDGVLLLGDNFYDEGVSGVEDSQWVEKFEQPYGTPCLKSVPFYPIFGNHDYRGNKDAQILYSAQSSHWVMPRRLYALEFDRLLRVVATDTNFPDACLSADSCALNFLWKYLRGSESKWTIGMGHYPLSTANHQDKRYRGATVQSSLIQGIVCDKADLWVSGHSHHLEHRRLPWCNTDLVVSGGGGGPLQNFVPHEPETKFAQKTHGFVEVFVTEQKLQVTYFNTKGEELYSFQRP